MNRRLTAGVAVALVVTTGLTLERWRQLGVRPGTLQEATGPDRAYSVRVIGYSGGEITWGRLLGIKRSPVCTLEVRSNLTGQSVQFWRHGFGVQEGSGVKDTLLEWTNGREFAYSYTLPLGEDGLPLGCKVKVTVSRKLLAVNVNDPADKPLPMGGEDASGQYPSY